MNLADLSDEYAQLWGDMRIIKPGDAKAAARKIKFAYPQYEMVEQETGVPWWLVGLIHKMESNCSFSTHLHNGDPLGDRTKQVPKGRPKKGEPPFEWHESAVDALTMKGLHKITDWGLARVAFELERYNGWGYRSHHKETLSPYLWSYTNHYKSGKYVADGKWSASAVSGQCGAMPILKCLMQLDAKVAQAIESKPANVVALYERDDAPATEIEPEEKFDLADTFSSLSDLARAGSRVAKVVRAIWAKVAAVVGGWAAMMFGGGDGFFQEHALVIILGLVALMGLMAFLFQHFLLTAARDGRYSPRKG